MTNLVNLTSMKVSPAVLHLPGLRKGTAAAHLGSLGLLRLLNEQLDPTITGAWDAANFTLTGLSRDELLDYLQHSYTPTPFASPWNGLSGFHPGDDPRARDAIATSDQPRLQPYRDTLQSIATTLAELGITEKPQREAKTRLMRRLLETLPEPAQRWPRAVYTISDDDIRFNSLLFTGGNDLRFDLSRAFMWAIQHLFLTPQGEQQSGSLLRARLFDAPAGKQRAKPGGPYEPASSASPNGIDSADISLPLSNPWTYLLTLEGLLELDSSYRRYPALAHQASLSLEETRRDDLSLPFWSQPLTYRALREALAQPDTLQQQLYAVVPRNGKAHFVLPTATRSFVPKPFWRGPREWLQQRRCRSPQSLRTIDEYLNGDGHPRTLKPGLLELGQLDLHHSDFPPLGREWARADDGTAEFALALSLASLGGGMTTDPDLQLRPQIDAIRGRDLVEAMLRLARRRIAQAREVAHRPNPSGILIFNDPFWSSRPASVDTIAAFLTGSLDEVRVLAWVKSLSLLSPDLSKAPAEGNVLRLPATYRLLKLGFHQAKGDRRPAPRIVLELLQQNRLDEALEHATRFLHPRHPLQKPPTLTTRPGEARRLAAALLIPIDNATYKRFHQSLL